LLGPVGGVRSRGIGVPGNLKKERVGGTGGQASEGISLRGVFKGTGRKKRGIALSKKNPMSEVVSRTTIVQRY